MTPNKTHLKALLPEDFLNGVVKAMTDKPDDKVLDEYIGAHKFDITKLPPEDSHIIFYNGMPIGSRGNIVSITGKAKSRKTVVASAVASSCFSPEGFLGFTADLGENENLLHIDTEQGYYHYYGSVARIFKDAGWAEEVPPNFFSVHTRDATVDFRIQLVEYLLEIHKPRVVILDGITDFVKNINDQDEATEIGEKLLSWSYKYDALIIVIIHTTKTTGYMTGAVGTHLEKKSQTVIKVEKDDDGKEDGDPNVSHVSCQYSRDKGFKSFSIQYVEELGRYDRLPEGEIESKGKKGDRSPGAYREEDHKLIITRTFGYNDKVPDEEIRKRIWKAVNSLGGDKLSKMEVAAFINFFNERAMMFQDPSGAGMRPAAGTTSNHTAPGETGLFTNVNSAPDSSDDLPF